MNRKLDQPHKNDFRRISPQKSGGWMDGWMDGGKGRQMGGWMDGIKAVLKIAYSNAKVNF